MDSILLIYIKYLPAEASFTLEQRNIW